MCVYYICSWYGICAGTSAHNGPPDNNGNLNVKIAGSVLCKYGTNKHKYMSKYNKLY